MRAALPLGEWAYFSDVAHQRDGKVVIVGRTHGGPGFPPDVALLRFTSSGAPDATFGLQGFARGSFGEIDYGHAIALQPDGKILVLASTWSFPDYVRNGRHPRHVLRHERKDPAGRVGRAGRAPRVSVRRTADRHGSKGR
ncbi:MAG: hypothetical protein JNK60_19835 [Acidobacteria bacterium]|nr:hypothetical protein [Acidobacteriota bacterium]